MRRTCFLLISALCAFGRQQQLDSFEANHRTGELYLKQHNLKAAIPYLETAWKLDASSYANAFDLAQAYLQTGSTIKCRVVLDALMKTGGTAELHNLMGDLEEAEKHVDAAARQYELAARMDPTEKNIFDLGSDLLKHNGFEPALKVFVFGTQKYPKSAQMLLGQGIAHYSMGQYDEAVQTLCEAVDEDPQSKMALEFLGKMTDVSPRYAKEVEARMERFVQNYPTSAAAKCYYAVSLRGRAFGHQLDDANTAKAKSLLQQAVQIDPQFTDAHFQLGLLYEDLHEDARAIDQYEVVVKQKPAFSKAHYRLAHLYVKSGKRDLAAKEFSAVDALKATTN